MAKYNITALNYMASGSNRNFINMDIELDKDIYHLYEYVHLLALEQKNWNRSVLSGDLLLEQRSGNFLKNEYLTTEFDLSTILSSEYEDKARTHAISYGENPQGIIIREDQTLYVEDKFHKGKYLRLYLSCCTLDQQEKLKKFIQESVQNGKIYEIELNQLNRQTNILSTADCSFKPIYDMDDVCIKSLNRESNKNIKNFDINRPTKTQDVYIPQDSKPISFGQAGQIVYLLTNKTANGCDRLFSDIRKLDAESGGYRMNLEHNKQKTYLYPSYEQLSVLSRAQVSSYEKALNIYQTDNAVEVFGNDSFENYFRPKINLDGIEYNYIAAVPVSEIQSEYRNGNIYADMYTAKNMYDSIYEMNMSANATIRGCREYTDIVQCGGQLYLKYYDNMDYVSPTISNDQNLSSLLVLNNANMHQINTGYPYQKIEALNPVVIRGQSNKHKSTFFSVQIKDIDVDIESLESNNKEQTEKLLNNIKFDIKTAIKEIAENVCPAHTQLFDVYFGNTI